MSSHNFPLSPPSSPAYLDNTFYTRAPLMGTVPLPPCCDQSHLQPAPRYHGVMTPHPSPPRVHPVLSAASTIVCYDLARDTQTIQMSFSSDYSFFPSSDPASSPSTFVLDVRCEATGHMIRVRSTRNEAVTCLDLMVRLHSFFEGEIGGEEWWSVRGARRRAMKKAYEQRTGFAYSGSAHMKRVDYLLGKTKFKQIIPQYGDSTWLLQTC